MENKEDFCHYSGLPSPMAYAKPAEAAPTFSDPTIDRIIEMAWEDRTPFEAVEFQFGLKEADVKVLMKRHLKLSSYKRWRKRVHRYSSKHLVKRSANITRFKSKMQRDISHNSISKRV